MVLTGATTELAKAVVFARLFFSRSTFGDSFSLPVTTFAAVTPADLCKNKPVHLIAKIVMFPSMHLVV